MRFGQAMAVWNCKFNGPRAGMYQTSKKTFKLALHKLFSGHDAPAEKEPWREDKIPRLKCLSASCMKMLRNGSSITKVA